MLAFSFRKEKKICFFIFLPGENLKFTFSLLVGEKRGFWRKSPTPPIQNELEILGIFKVLLDRIRKWDFGDDFVFLLSLSREKRDRHAIADAIGCDRGELGIFWG